MPISPFWLELDPFLDVNLTEEEVKEETFKREEGK